MFVILHASNGLGIRIAYSRWEQPSRTGKVSPWWADACIYIWRIFYQHLSHILPRTTTQHKRPPSSDTVYSTTPSTFTDTWWDESRIRTVQSCTGKKYSFGSSISYILWSEKIASQKLKLYNRFETFSSQAPTCILNAWTQQFVDVYYFRSHVGHAVSERVLVVVRVAEGSWW